MMKNRLLSVAATALLALGLGFGGAGTAVAQVAPVDEPTTTDVQESTDTIEPTAPQPKVFVCKFVGKPGVNETLQTGNNPISVNANTLPIGWAVGESFADDQGRSFVLALDEGQDKPDAKECLKPLTPVTPEASATQAVCVSDSLVAGYITVDVTIKGVAYEIDNAKSEPVKFDETTGKTGALEPGKYTVYGMDADPQDDYDAAKFMKEFEIKALDCTKELAETGADESILGIGIGAAALTLAGLGLVLRRRLTTV